MTVNELLKHFEKDSLPLISAAAFLQVHPETIRRWQKKNNQLPPQWEAYFHRLNETQSSSK